MVDRHRSREREYAALARRVGSHLRLSCQSLNRSHVDNRSAASAAHQRDGVLGSKELTFEIYTQDLIPCFFSSVHGGSVALNVAVIAPRAFVFVEPRRFLEPVRPTTVVNNTTIINKTANITNIKVVNNTVINEGPRTQVIEQASGRTLQPLPVHELRRKQEAGVVARQRIATPAAENKTQVESLRRANEAAAKGQEETRSKANGKPDPRLKHEPIANEHPATNTFKKAQKKNEEGKPSSPENSPAPSKSSP